MYVWVRYGTWTCWGAMRIGTHRGTQKSDPLLPCRNSHASSEVEIWKIPQFSCCLHAFQKSQHSKLLSPQTNMWVLWKTESGRTGDRRANPWCQDQHKERLCHTSLWDIEWGLSQRVWRTAKDFWLHGYFRPHSAAPADLGCMAGTRVLLVKQLKQIL